MARETIRQTPTNIGGSFKPRLQRLKPALAVGEQAHRTPPSDEIRLIPEGVMHEIPVGARHRLLDWTTEALAAGRANGAYAKAYFHRSHHFALGFRASEHLLILSTEHDLVDQMQEFAPHPFDDYTISAWSGTGDGVAEVLVSVRKVERGVEALMVAMPWPGTKVIGGESNYLTRDEGMQASGADRLAWMIVDAFRLILAQPGAAIFGERGPNRHSIRKGKRVTYYSQSEITINLDAVKRPARTAATGNGKIMPAYQYRAHPCHSGGRKGCDHYWIEIGGRMDENNVWHPDPKPHGRDNATWECYHCSRRRWHRRAGQRGDASHGFVRQTYNVKKGDDE